MTHIRAVRMRNGLCCLEEAVHVGHVHLVGKVSVRFGRQIRALCAITLELLHFE